MGRSREYRDWVDTFTSGEDGLPLDEEEEAYGRDIGWFKREQIKKAIRAARGYKDQDGHLVIATPEQLHLLWMHDIALPAHAKERLVRKLRQRGEELPFRFKKEERKLVE